MKRFLILFMLWMSACTPAAAEPPPLSVTKSAPTNAVPVEPPAIATLTSQPSPTPVPQGIIRVDSFEQETYPFLTNGNCTLGEAITAANTLQPVDACAAGAGQGSTIELMPGTYLLTSVDESPAFHLDGSEWERRPSQVAGLPVLMGRATIHGNGAILQAEKNSMPAILITSSPGAFIEDLTLRGGGRELDPTYTLSYDTGNYWNAGEAVLRRVRIENGIADNGAGVANGAGSLELVDCTVTGNSARYSGGGIRNFGALKITGSRIENNTANDGAGMTLHAGETTILNSDIAGNIAKFNGGGIQVDPWRNPVSLLLQDSRVSGNSAGEVNGMGGGIWLDFPHYGDFEIVDHTADLAGEFPAKVEIVDTQIEENVAAGGAGIAWADHPDSQLIIKGSTLSRNRAVTLGRGGGAIFNYGGTIQIEDSAFLENYSFRGGAIYMRAGILSISGSTFDSNFAETGEKGSIYVSSGFGGAIMNEGGQLSVEETVFRLNQATIGGAVFHSHPGLSRCQIIPEAFTRIENSCFLANDATYDASDYPQGDQIAVQQCLNPNKNPSLEAAGNWWGTDALPDENQVFGKVSMDPILSSPPAFCE